MGSSRFFSALSAVLFLALCAYVGAALYPTGTASAADIAPAVTAAPVLMRGIAIREEQSFDCSSRAESGLRLAAGSVFGTAKDGSALCTPDSAVFFAECDGYEGLSPALLNELTPEALEVLLSSKPDKRGSCRLVTGRDWYYAALAPDDFTTPPRPRCRLMFSDIDRAYDAYMISASAPENGQRMLLFRLTAGDDACLSLRQVSAYIVTN